MELNASQYAKNSTGKNKPLNHSQENHKKEYEDLQQDDDDEMLDFYYNHIWKEEKDLSYVNGDYLKTIMPNNDRAKRSNIVDVLERDCLEYMKQRAKEKEFSCKYPISSIFPGLPLFDPDVIAPLLWQRIIARDGIRAYIDGERNNKMLVITWA